MLSVSLVLFILAVVSAVLGFGMENWTSEGFRIAFFVLLAGFVATFLSGLAGPRRPHSH